MKELGYGKEYLYDPNEPEGLARQEYLPESLRGMTFYQPGGAGAEVAIAARLAWWKERRGRGAGADPKDE
jgi:putative ATPase